MEIAKEKPVLYLISIRDIVDNLKYILQTTRYDLVAQFDHFSFFTHIVNELNGIFLDTDSRPIDHAVAHLVRQGVPGDLAFYMSEVAMAATFDLITSHLSRFSFREISVCEFTQHEDEYALAILIPAGLGSEVIKSSREVTTW